MSPVGELFQSGQFVNHSSQDPAKAVIRGVRSSKLDGDKHSTQYAVHTQFRVFVLLYGDAMFGRYGARNIVDANTYQGRHVYFIFKMGGL